MISLLYAYWKHQKLRFKIMCIVIAVLLIYSIVNISKVAYYKYKYFKNLEKQHKELKAELEVVNTKEVKIISKSKIRTKNVQNNLSKIDKKLKEDEKLIDNNTVTGDELDEFLSRFD